MSIVTYENVDTPVFEIDFLRYLFANGEAGFWLPFTPDHLYADVDKTVPATIGGGIASFDDLSGNGVAGPQPTSTARPIFRASPARGEYDLADDVLPRDATLPAITDGTVILIGKQGIWIDEGYSFAGGNWSFGPTTYPNGPDGIIGVVGDMLDLVVLDRPLTPSERDRVVAYGVKRGSAGALMPSGAGIISLMRPSVNTAPSDWVRYHDGKVYADGAEWQNIIDSSPVYTGITPEVIDGQHMVRVPKFWIKTQDTAAGGVIYSVSDTPQPGFQVHPAFYSAGEEIDRFWIGAYHASEVDNVFESQPNVLPRVNLSGVTAIERMEARNTGGQTGWGSLTWHQICAVKLLCLIEIGTPDPRTAIGQGWNSTTSNSGSGAELQPTGTSDANWRGIYDLWGNVNTLCTGLEFRSGRAWLADENGVLADTGHDIPAENRYIGACAGGGLGWAFLPTADGPTASNAGYTAYHWTNILGTQAVRHGFAFSYNPAFVGLFSLHSVNTLGHTHATFGFRLAKV